MAMLEYAIWGFFIGFPIYNYLTTDKERKAVNADPSQRLKIYRTAIFNLWWPTILLLILVFNGHVGLTDIGLKWQWDTANQVFMAITLVFSGYFVIIIRHLKNDEQARHNVLKQVDSYSYFLPTDKKEFRLFTWGICVSAGICEELLFRGYLLHVLSAQMPMIAAVIVASIIFGLPHIYQGFKGVVRTALFGVVFVIIYLVTDSLLIPIILHIIADIYSGYLSYISMTGQAQTKSC